MSSIDEIDLYSVSFSLNLNDATSVLVAGVYSHLSNITQNTSNKYADGRVNHIIAIVQRDGDIISFASSDQHDVKGAYTRLHRI